MKKTVKKNSNSICFSGDISWVKGYLWSINKKDIDYFMKKIDSEKYLKENKFRIKSNRVNMVSNKMINEMTDEDFTDAFIQNRNYYCLSNPVFNQTEDIAIIKYKIVFKNTDIFLYNLNFYKKINGKWIKICAVVPTRE